MIQVFVCFFFVVFKKKQGNHICKHEYAEKKVWQDMLQTVYSSYSKE